MAKVDEIRYEIEVPDGVKPGMKDNLLTVKGSKGELQRSFSHPRVKMSVSKGIVVVQCAKPKRTERGLLGTWRAHVKNMFRGVTDGYTYRMRIIYSHFPIKTSMKGNELVVENFLGEKHPRKARIREGVTAKISGDSIVLEGIDKEQVGQTAANIEKVTQVKNYDPRVFQDGIYLVSKGD